MKNNIKCKHEEFLDEIIGELEDLLTGNARHYLYTTMFIYLHGGKDYCDCKKDEL